MKRERIEARKRFAAEVAQRDLLRLRSTWQGLLPRSPHGGFAVACYEAADGDPLSALALACDMLKRLQPEIVAGMIERAERLAA